MKPILISALVALLGLGQTAYAQTAPGQWFGGGTMSMSIIRPADNGAIRNRGFGFSLSPRVGYFALNRLAVGFTIPISYARNRVDFTGNTSTAVFNSISANVFTRYYLRSAKFTPFLQGELGYSRFSSKTTIQSITPSSDTDGRFNYALGGGLAYFVTPQVAIEGTLEYTNRNNTGATEWRLIDFRVGLMMYFGKGK
jgi:opacity protein-like surface antigen